ncbi:MAG: hypothetical protein HC800_07350 [Phormidesmis sp. RL_2_1]|nr:hypothetical protein [Phormidesmis sp. RL_2_1]
MNTRLILSQTTLQRVSDAKTTALFESCDPSKRTLILIWPQFGDFDTLEYAWWIKRDRAKLNTANIQVRAVGIGDAKAGEQFCTYTHFPANHLFIDPTASLHHQLDLYRGLKASLPGFFSQRNAQLSGYLNLLLMCAGIGSPGTLKEVLRGYTGDKSAPQLIADDEVIKAAPLPALKGEVFQRAGGKGFQRPFELATLRLRNMAEVLSKWKTYVPDAAYLTQRGATFLFEADRVETDQVGTDQVGTDSRLLYEWRDRNILGFSPHMSDPINALLTASLKGPAQEG